MIIKIIKLIIIPERFNDVTVVLVLSASTITVIPLGPSAFPENKNK